MRIRLRPTGVLHVVLFALLASGLVAGCSSVFSGLGAVTGPTLSLADESKMARDNAVKYEKEHDLWKDPLLEAYVGQIVQRVGRVVPAEKGYPWSVRIVTDPAVNAFTFGGGLIYVNLGLVARMENEAQLATVLSHEMAHSTERHIPRSLKARHGMNAVGKLAGSVVSGVAGAGVPTSFVQLTGTMMELGLTAAVSGHSRGHEREADTVGLQYLVDGGYDPREAPRTFERLLEEYGDPAPVDTFFYGSHPSNTDRYAYLTKRYERLYSSDLENRELITNSEEFKRRTREAVVLVGVLDYGNKRFKTSAAMFEKALAVEPGDPIPHFWIGKLAHETEGDAEKAVLYLSKAIELDDAYSDAYRELGTAFYLMGDRKKAVRAYERYLKLAPDAEDKVQIAKSIDELGRY